MGYLLENMREGVIMFLSFAFFGSLPLLGYVIIPMTFGNLDEEFLFMSACFVTGIVLFFMGSIKSQVSSTHWLWSGIETLLLGGTCATVAYSIGQFVDNLIAH